MEEVLSARIRSLRATARQVVDEVIAPHAEKVDRDCSWPEESMHALADAGLLGLLAPTTCGGHGQGLLALAVVTETLAQGCASTAICYGMHCVGTAVIAAKATPHQSEKYLRAIALGKHLTSLALSEAGTGAHFYLPQTELARGEDGFVVNGSKHFVTNGGHADSYVISTAAGSPGSGAGEFSCLIVDSDTDGLGFLEPWQGLGMRGNSSREMRLEKARVPAANLLGEEGDQTWYLFEVVAPYFLMATAGTYLGVAQAALDQAIGHLRSRVYSHSGDTLARVPVLQTRVAELWMTVQKTRAHIYRAAQMGDVGDQDALVPILTCKVAAAEAAVEVTNEAMTLCGGMAYRENDILARLMRDARASHVMSPTTELLKQWAGRSLLGLPVL